MPNEIKSLPDGKISARLETGEIFEGDPLEVTTKLAEAHQHTKKWGQEWKAKAEAPPPAPPPVVDANEAQMQKYVADNVAKYEGYKDADERKAELATLRQSVLNQNRQAAIATFHSLCPEYPNTDAASDKLIERVQKDFQIKDFDEFSAINPELAATCLKAAHRDCVAEGLYQPLDGAEQAATTEWEKNLRNSNRVIPPPMLRSNSPDSSAGFNPWSKDVKLEDLRAMAIKQQLEGR